MLLKINMSSLRKSPQKGLSMKQTAYVFLLLMSMCLFASSLVFAAVTTVDVRVSRDSSDAEETVSNGSMYIGSSDLELTWDGHNQIVGLRFRKVNIPSGVTITSAYIEFTVDEANNNDNVDGTLTIEGEDVGDADRYEDIAYNISSRPRTSASAVWGLDDSNEWENVGDKEQTPDLSALVQEIIDRGDWSSGNDMAFIVSGTGKRVADSRDGSSSKAPLLHIEYTETVGAGIAVEPGASLGAWSYEGMNADPTSFVLSNSGNAPLSYSISDDASWVGCVTNCTGTLAPNETIAVQVYFSNYTLAVGNYYGHFTIVDDNEVNNSLEYDVILAVQEVTTGSTCGDVPIYAQDLVDPAILVLLDVSGSMTNMMPLTSSASNPLTPDLQNVVQEIVNQAGWVSGNDMAFVISGTGKRVVESYDGVSSAAPLLSVKYSSSGVAGSVSTRVSQTSDDAEESSSGSISLTSSDLELIREGSNQVVGVRFQDVGIPQGATITNASIEFVVDEGAPTELTTLTLKGELAVSADSFSDTTNNISNRTTTTESVTWMITDQWQVPPEKARYVIGREVISELVEDQAISWGFGTWSFKGHNGPSSDPDMSLLPGNPYGNGETNLYTSIRGGVKHRNDTDTTALKAIIESTTADGGTPLGPSLLAAWQYYAGKKSDHGGGNYDSTVTCQPKFLIDITDGLGYEPHTNVSIMAQYTNLLADNKISPIAVGFGIDDATQIQKMAEVANTRGSEDGLYALHEEDASGVGQPFMAQNQQELTAALQSITNNIKQQIFIGSSPAPSTSVDAGTFVINASFNAATWGGDLTATPYDPATGAFMMCVDASGNQACDSVQVFGKCLDLGLSTCNPADIIEEECLCWTATDVMPATKNAWTVDGDVSASGTMLSAGMAGHYVNDHTALSDYDIGLDGDNYICKDLGDIIKSTPVIVESPRKYYGFDNYRAFQFGTARSRDKMLYVGANDGALHALNLVTGVEKWRFYPEAVHQLLIDKNICDTNYCHEYFVDGTPVAADVYRGANYDSPAGQGWRTMLLAGLGAGGDAYFALDVTSANSFVEGGTDSTQGTTYMWQFSDAELGLTTGEAVIARTSVAGTDYGGWAAYFGSGYGVVNSPFKEAYVYGIEAYSMDDLWNDGTNDFNRVKLEEDDRIFYTTQVGNEFAVGQTISGKTSSASAVILEVFDDGTSGTLKLSTIVGTFVDGEVLMVGTDEIATLYGPLHSVYYDDALSDTLVADIDFDNSGDFLYAGNLYGRMYRLHNIAKGEQPVVDLLFDIDPSTVNHNTPIRAGASYGFDTVDNTVWVYFGSGKFEDQTDKFNSQQQYFVGIQDHLVSPVQNSTLTDLLERTTVAVDATFNGETKEYRVVTGQSFVYEGTDTLVVGRAMTGDISGATGVIASLTTLNGQKIVTFEEASVTDNGVFEMREDITDSSANRVTLKGHPWYAKLIQAAGVPSERVIAKSLVVGEVVFFTSFIPDIDVCGGNGAAWLYALNYETGLPATEPVFDLNGDGYMNDDDVVTHDGKNYYVAAIPIGRGIPSSPVLEGDMIFVNTTDKARAGLPVNLPKLKAVIDSWKDGRF